MTNTLALKMALPLALVWVSMLVSPLLTRREVFFSVTVSPDFRSTRGAQRILRRYWLWLSLWCGLVFVAGWAGLAKGPGAAPALVFIGLAGAYPAFFHARRQTLAHAISPSMVREANLSPARPSTFESSFWELPPFLFLGLTAVTLVTHWPEIPARFPIHYDLSGVPNGWAERTPVGVLGGLAVELGVLTLLVFGRTVMLRARRSRLSGPGAEEELRLRRRASQVLLALEYAIAIGASRLELSPLWAGPVVAEAKLMSLVVIGLTLALLLVVLRSRQRAASSGGDGTEESHWKAGIFYVNADDPAIFVEKRFGFGWTLNFGRPAAYAMLVALVGLPLAAAIFLSTHR